jgi:hypothetical protein
VVEMRRIPVVLVLALAATEWPVDHGAQAAPVATVAKVQADFNKIKVVGQKLHVKLNEERVMDGAIV